MRSAKALAAVHVGNDARDFDKRTQTADRDAPSLAHVLHEPGRLVVDPRPHKGLREFAVHTLKPRGSLFKPGGPPCRKLPGLFHDGAELT